MIESKLNSMIKIALCQMKILENKNKNIEKASNFIKKSKENNANIIILPEMFNCMYDKDSFKNSAEFEGEQTFKFLKEISLNCLLIGGSIVEKDKNGFFYNTSYIFENKKLIGKYRKINLFDINIKNINFKESNFFTPGEKSVVINSCFGKIGILICFDIRFPELFIQMKKYKNPFLYIIPSTFNHITGAAHSKILVKSRAVDFQSFIALVSSASNYSASYNPYGHSLLAGPWGNIIGELKYKEELLLKKINLKQINLIKQKISISY